MLIKVHVPTRILNIKAFSATQDIELKNLPQKYTFSFGNVPFTVNRKKFDFSWK